MASHNTKPAQQTVLEGKYLAEVNSTFAQKSTLKPKNLYFPKHLLLCVTNQHEQMEAQKIGLK